MHIGELAKLAGITKRTLYHWHELGILPEPVRHDNGYRHYTVMDLLKVLRIRQLTSLGLTLSQAAQVLDDGPSSHPAALDELATSIATQIAQLERQLELVRELKDGRLEIDLPPNVSRMLKQLGGYTGPAGVFERDVMHLAAAFAGPEAITQLERVFELTSKHFAAEDLGELASRFSELPATASDEDIQQLAAENLKIIRFVYRALAKEKLTMTLTDNPIETLLRKYDREVLNEAQQRVMAIIEAEPYWV